MQQERLLLAQVVGDPHDTVTRIRLGALLEVPTERVVVPKTAAGRAYAAYRCACVPRALALARSLTKHAARFRKDWTRKSALPMTYSSVPWGIEEMHISLSSCSAHLVASAGR